MANHSMRCVIGAMALATMAVSAQAAMTGGQWAPRPSLTSNRLHFQQAHLIADSTAVTEAVREARRVIQSQLDAFAADDGQRAFSFAAPGIQARFGSAENFMSMVRGAYPAVIGPASVRFLPADSSNEVIVQPVELQDRQGRLWLAVYALSREPGSGWRIEGCQLIEQAVTAT